MSFIFDWFQNLYCDLLYYLGYGKKGKLLLLGLDDAGKTTLLGLLKHNTFGSYLPSHFPTSETLVMNNIELTTFDLGGHKQVRRIW